MIGSVLWPDNCVLIHGKLINAPETGGKKIIKFNNGARENIKDKHFVRV